MGRKEAKALWSMGGGSDGRSKNVRLIERCAGAEVPPMKQLRRRRRRSEWMWRHQCNHSTNFSFLTAKSAASVMSGSASMSSSGAGC